MIFVSAGFDAHREDELGQLGLVEADYTWITRADQGRRRPACARPHRVVPGRRLQPRRAGAQRGRTSARPRRIAGAGWPASVPTPRCADSGDLLDTARELDELVAARWLQPGAARRAGDPAPACLVAAWGMVRLLRGTQACRSPRSGSDDRIFDGVLFPVLALALAFGGTRRCSPVFGVQAGRLPASRSRS